MLGQHTLDLTSTLRELPAWETWLEITCSGSELGELFEREPALPGVILMQGQHYRGMISRRRFFEQMSRPYSQELFRKRSLETFYPFVEADILILSDDTSIIHATQIALQRDRQLSYEPLLIKAASSSSYKVIDFHQLLLAYSQIPDLALHHMQKAEQAAQTVEAEFLELRKNYTHYLQTEKMASLGQLVAGLAHEINNPVNFIYGNLNYVRDYSLALLNFVQLYQAHYPHPAAEIQAVAEEMDLEFLLADMPKLLESMKVGTERIREIISSLRSFVRMDEADLKAVDIHAGIDSTLMILQHRTKATPTRPAIKVIKEYGQLPIINCYPGQLNQVFMNILANAIDALDEASGTASAQAMSEGSGQITIRTFVKDSECVQIEISDNGSGIPEAIHNRIFDPFFTTKAVGQGTGLGMSISYQIITKRHGGRLQFFSKSGEGTTFIIQLLIDGIGNL